MVYATPVIFSSAKVAVYMDAADSSEHSVARLLVEDGVIAADVVARAWAELYNVPYCDIAEIAPRLAVEGVTKIDRKALRAKSPEPPIPFWIREPITWVEFTLP